MTVGLKRKGARWLGRWSVLAASCLTAASLATPVVARAEMPDYKLSLLPEDDSVYAPPTPPREEDAVNGGGVNLDLSFAYLSDYVYRGVDHTNFEGRHKKPDVQFSGRAEFNLGKLPHPYVGIFANIYNNDPVSRFQEIRPFGGLVWTLRPFTIDGGINWYIYPEREHFNTSEVYGRVTFDDSFLFKTERPIFSPYVFGAYDYDLNHGFYIEAGVKHDFVIEDTGVTLTVVSDVAYVSHIRQEFIFTSLKQNGFQHYDVGLIGTYSLNQLFHLSQRYGEIDLKGYLYYTDGIEREILHSDTKIWGGVGVEFKY